MTALATRARVAGIEIREAGGRSEAWLGKKILAFHVDPKRALSLALERVEEDRLRKLPYDQEIVLLPRPSGRAVAPVRTSPVVSPEAGAIVVAAIAAASLAPLPTAPRIIKGSIIKSKYKDKYKAHGMSCGDEISEELALFVKVQVGGKLVVDLKKLRQVADDNGLWKDSYLHLNPGQLRMTIGNRLRIKHAIGDAINIGGVVLQLEIE